MGQDVLFQVGELAFDSVEPRRVGRRELKAHVVASGPRSDRGRLVSAQVVEHDPDPSGVLAADGLEQRQELEGSLSPPAMTPEPARSHIIGRQQMAHPVTSGIGRTLAMGRAARPPRAPAMGSKFHGTELVDADHLFASRLGRLVESLDGVFFTSNSGSVDCFQVLVRWSEI